MVYFHFLGNGLMPAMMRALRVVRRKIEDETFT